MPVKVKVPRFAVKVTRRNVLILVAGVCAVGLVVGLSIFFSYWNKYGTIVNNRLKEPLFVHTAQIYAAPPEVRPGQTLTAQWVVGELQQAGYTLQGQTPASSMGTYGTGPGTVMVNPGPNSYHAQDPATVSFSNGSVSQIIGAHGEQLAAYELEPLLVTGLSDESRAKRRLVAYNDLPRYMVPAVTSIEDRRFFQHGALDYDGVARSALNDLRPGRHTLEGASTIDMQLAKMFFLTPQRTFKRKFLQVIIALQLEHHFSKQQIFQMYANEVPLGEVGSYAIDGFGEAAQAYFGKDVGQLNLPQCALLAGMIQSPSWLNPFRHPQRAMVRRNVVLDAMVETGAITKQQAEQAKSTPVDVVPGAFDSGDAPWFTELVRQQLQQQLQDPNYNEQGLRIYTSLDPDLQQVAQNAVAEGIQQTDKVVRARYERRVRLDKKRGIKPPPLVYPQVALVALNPHTGQVLALVGGRNYAASQLDHVIAHRPTGSIFKPFVYAAAFNTAVSGTQLTNPSGQSGIFTPLTILHDEPTTFTFANNQTYSPHDFNNEYYGDVPAVEALYRSLNNATVELAEMVGYDNVANLARAAGISSVQATPAMAIGSYDATPMEMAGAYTVFANGGVKIDPWMLASVRAPNGNIIANYSPKTTTLLDPRVSFLTVGLMEQVLNNRYGTGAGMRSIGFTAPAAAKTGTSHDAWFAGFTSNLLCVVWVGNDDYSQLNIEGDRAAGPIWGDFMKEAVKLPEYSDTEQFNPPPGVVQVQLDNTTDLLADAACPDDWTATFLEGTEPTQTCDHPIGLPGVLQKIFGLGKQPFNGPAPPKVVQQGNQPPQSAAPAQPAQGQNQNAQQAPEQKKKKPGFWARLFGKHDDSQDQQNQKH
ncbi:MAG TPA: transglycosylase domain-containing protein [Terracidiphilus sp.]|nr:transglycosylase domain-containing protein [Terracidiphilus sp.]